MRKSKVIDIRYAYILNTEGKLYMTCTDGLHLLNGDEDGLVWTKSNRPYIKVTLMHEYYDPACKIVWISFKNSVLAYDKNNIYTQEQFLEVV